MLRTPYDADLMVLVAALPSGIGMYTQICEGLSIILFMVTSPIILQYLLICPRFQTIMRRLVVVGTIRPTHEKCSMQNIHHY